MKVKEKKMRETITKISNLLETKISTHILFIRKHLIKTYYQDLRQLRNF